MNISLDNVSLISTAVEALLYGFSVFMFGATMWILLRLRRGVNRVMVFVASLLLFLSTIVSAMALSSLAHIGVDIYRAREGLIYRRNYIGLGSSAWFGDVSDFTWLFKNSLYMFQTLTGDAIIIYRCYIVWQSIWVIALPVLSWFGAAAAGIGGIYSCSRTDPLTGDYVGVASRWITAFLSLTLSTNFIATILLTSRIWRSTMRTRHYKTGPSLLPVAKIMLDAAVIYSATLLALIICFVAEWNGQYIILDMASSSITPVISIAFYMVIMRLGMREMSLSSALHPGSQGKTRPSEFGMGPLEVTVHIDQLTEGARTALDSDGMYGGSAGKVVASNESHGILKAPPCEIS
ncbi:hypothetical protein FA95DRAFT_1486721 [Auriscalpium vulgare]|uniref:Uncharacterized protein n=1 Tax=Auriscalpium vulgare TaxID=40419 RepID=A0ACB8S3D4_9AGAM|nr:hypothetical protein FA95DRAFT_1486721 [Auriscalpium vulgare]